jgi:hypothetical protein
MSTSPIIFLTNFFGAYFSAANVGAGFLNVDGSYNVSGTVIGTARTVRSVAIIVFVGRGRLATQGENT